MKRDIEIALNQWHTAPNRQPLLLRGARQVGKSTSIEQFAQHTFSSSITINFEQRPEFKSCFKTLIPTEIIEALELVSGQDIIPGETLLFLDEIQECPRAITAMRYFFEQMPQLHVIGAGSLLEFAINAEDFRMPVGRIEFLYMYPMSFAEFLSACGEDKLRSRIVSVIDTPLIEVVHEKLLGLLRKYMLLGGMPAVVKHYIETGRINASLKIQANLVETYRADFSKYAKSVKIKYLQKVYAAAPKLVGNKFKYSNVDRDIQSRELKQALELLEMAGVVKLVKASSGSALPLEAETNDRLFKVIFLDIGLMQNICGLQRQLGTDTNLMQINKGALAEQLIGQELLTIQSNTQRSQLHYWAREARNSSAEIDYLLQLDNEPTPIEVKSGKGGSLKSLSYFNNQYRPRQSLRFSTEPYSVQSYEEGTLISLPLYAVAALQELL